MSDTKILALIIIVVLLTSGFWWIYSNDLSQENNYLKQTNSELVQEINDLAKNFQRFKDEVSYSADFNCTAVTISYFTNFSQNQHFISFSVPFEKYHSYHTMNHPSWGISNLEPAIEYISTNDTIIKLIVETIKNQTESEEELANALLSFVQDRGNALNIRYFPTTELKYPIETLVEMGGDCDTHSILYLTLMKIAGFKCLLLYSNETIQGQYHVATAIRLPNPPTNSLPEIEDHFEVYDGEKYYYAETTNGNLRVGDFPPKYENLTFNLLPI